MYGAPVWSEAFNKKKNARTGLNRVWRSILIRVISAYRTVSLDAASLLARMPPLHMIARARTHVYLEIGKLRKRSEANRQTVKAVRVEAEERLREEWLAHLNRDNVSGVRTMRAILPQFKRWLDREHGYTSFRLTQMFTGHGCFASYLHRIGKVDSSGCQECGLAIEDTVEHTIQECTRWTSLREDLIHKIGPDLSLPVVMSGMLESEDKWMAVSYFAETVISTKEEEERLRQGVVPTRALSPSQMEPGG